MLQTDGLLRQNTISDNEICGIKLIGESIMTIEENAIESNGTFGIDLEYPSDPKLIGNKVTKNTF